jgi:hypothetical protein
MFSSAWTAKVAAARRRLNARRLAASGTAAVPAACEPEARGLWRLRGRLVRALRCGRSSLGPAMSIPACLPTAGRGKSSAHYRGLAAGGSPAADSTFRTHVCCDRGDRTRDPLANATGRRRRARCFLLVIGNRLRRSWPLLRTPGRRHPRGPARFSRRLSFAPDGQARRDVAAERKQQRNGRQRINDGGGHHRIPRSVGVGEQLALHHR